jgi:hypothetical protein
MSKATSIIFAIFAVFVGLALFIFMASEPGPREKKLRLENVENCGTATNIMENIVTDKSCLLYPWKFASARAKDMREYFYANPL